MNQKLFITTAIPYVNAPPHLGFALEIVFADALARWARLLGRSVYFLTGTDENSLTNVRAADQEKIEVGQLVERNAVAYEALGEGLDLSFDDFIRTSSDERHPPAVDRMWEACRGRGDIYTDVYRGWYCTSCEIFYRESEAPERRCPDHGTSLEYLEESNYFFRLSGYASELTRVIENGELEIRSESRRREALGWTSIGLEDISISRSFERARGWGIPVPGDPSQIVYVWFDALTNYISALGWPDTGGLYEEYWTSDAQRVHVIGKNIVRQHAIYWPAMLFSAGLPLPTTLLVHGFITADGARMSKTRGNVVDPVETARTYGVDVLRYVLLRRSVFEDIDFTVDDLVRVYHSDLAHSLGNLVSRVTAMVNRYRRGKVPAAGSPSPPERRLSEAAEAFRSRYVEAAERWQADEGLKAVFDLVGEVNRYIVKVEPWSLARDERYSSRLDAVLGHLVECLRIVSVGLAPFMPSTSRKIFEAIACHGGARDLKWGGYSQEAAISPSEPLFPRLEGGALKEAPI
jgi:methionyl-tRNA synthetase